MQDENIFVILLDLFNPTVIYAQLDSVVDLYWSTLVPAIMVLSVATRFLELQYENLGEGAKWGEALRDMKMMLIFTALYAGFGALVIKFHMVICQYMYANGSLKELLSGYSSFIEEIQQTDDQNLLDKIGNTISQYSVEVVVMKVLHFLSYLLLAAVNTLLRIIYALAFCLLYVWGMFAVPTMATKLFNIASGWFRGVMALFLWPLVEAVIYALINPMFTDLGEKITSSQAQAISAKLANLSLVYTFANILLMAVGVAAFFIAVVLSMNQNYLAGMGTGIMAAWAAGASLVMNGTRLVTKGARTIATIKTGSTHGPTRGEQQDGGGTTGPGPPGSLDGLRQNGGSGGGQGAGGQSASSNPGPTPSRASSGSLHQGVTVNQASTSAPAVENQGHGSNSAGSAPGGGPQTASYGASKPGDTGRTRRGRGVDPPTGRKERRGQGARGAKNSGPGSPGINSLRPPLRPRTQKRG